MTADEIIAGGYHLAHFNPNHDPSTGRFAKSGLGRAIARHKQNKIRTDDYTRYAELSKRDPRSLTNEELSFLVNRRELEKKAKGKTPAREAAEAELARFAVKTIATAAVLTATAVGANYLRKKYGITCDKIAKKVVSGAGKFTSTIAKETATSVTKAVKDSLPTIKDTSKTVSKAVGKTAVDTLANIGDAELKAIDKAKTTVSSTVGKAIDTGSKTKTIKVMSDAVGVAEKAGKTVGNTGKTVGKSVLDGMAAVGDVELKAIESGKRFLKRFGL